MHEPPQESPIAWDLEPELVSHRRGKLESNIAGSGQIAIWTWSRILGIRRLTTKVILEMDMGLLVAALQRRSRASLFHIRNVIHGGKLINTRGNYHEHNITYIIEVPASSF